MVEERDRNLMNNAISSRSDVYSHFLSGWDMKEMAEREKREKASREKSKQEGTVLRYADYGEVKTDVVSISLIQIR